MCGHWSVPVTYEMIPRSIITVFFEDDNGTLVTESMDFQVDEYNPAKVRLNFTILATCQSKLCHHQPPLSLTDNRLINWIRSDSLVFFLNIYFHIFQIFFNVFLALVK